MILFFDSARLRGIGGRDLWVTSRETTNDLWTEPVNLGRTVNTLSWDVAPNISSNGLVLFFMSDRRGRYGDFDAWVITDDQWHHVGFVCDGSYRFLYVDGIEVAKDTSIQTQPLMSSNGGLYIGSGKNLDGGTFFFGLIDDVRIYDMALSSEEIAALTW
jgi:hypothetical protein